jgi:hypothetical protein
MDIQARSQENQRKAAAEVVKAQQQERDSQRQAATAAAKVQSDLQVAGVKDETERLRLAAEQARSERQGMGMQRGFGGQQI